MKSKLSSQAYSWRLYSLLYAFATLGYAALAIVFLMNPSTIDNLALGSFGYYGLILLFLALTFFNSYKSGQSARTYAQYKETHHEYSNS